MAKTTPSVIHSVPWNMDAELFDKIVFKICNIFHENNITIKQAQSILECCEDMLLETVTNV